jgi:hypothetical protein
MIDKLKQHRLLFFLIGISIGLFILYLKIQPDLNYTFSPLFDGGKYLKVYQYFAKQVEQFNAIFPINTRILVPYLAALVPLHDPVHGFLWINSMFTVLSVISIYFLWRQLDISSGHIMTGFFWLLIHWAGLIRHNIFDPITVDVPLYFFQALLIIIILKRKYLLLLLLGPIATLQKESYLGLLIVILLVSLYNNYSSKSSYKNSLIIGLALLLSYTTKAIAGYYFPPIDPGKNSIIVILFHMKETILNPFRFVRWIVAVFTAYGPLLMLADSLSS